MATAQTEVQGLVKKLIAKVSEYLPQEKVALVEAAVVAARHGPPALRTFYLRLRATKGHQVAMVAVAAKLARIA